jgi:S1-C subfamily serine protease
MPRLLIAAFLAIGAARAVRADDALPPEVLQKVKQASVFIKVTLGPLEFSGSGFVIQTDGQTAYLVTNEHVVGKPNLEGLESLPPWLRLKERLEFALLLSTIQNSEPEVTAVFNSGSDKEQVLKAETIAVDKTRDLAILKVSGVTDVPKPIPLDMNFKPVETTPVFIFGFPFGEALWKGKGNPAITVGRGAVSSLRRDESGADDVVQIDGALNPGNSGGAVVDATGRLVGVARATIWGTGIGFAIPPVTLHKMLAGRTVDLHISHRAEPDRLAVDIAVTLVDPFRKIKSVAVHCTPREVKPVDPAPQQPLEQSEKIELVVENKKGTGTWIVPKAAGKPAVISLQLALTDTEGNAFYLAATPYRFSPAAPPPGRPIVPIPRPAIAGNRKVHSGAASTIGDKTITGGILVLGERSQGIAFGVVQTGEATMEFTYFAVVRLPAAKFNRTTFVTRNKTTGELTRAVYGAYLDDESLTIEHARASEKLPLEKEELTILDEKFDPANGRLFLVDMNGAAPSVMQQKLDLPSALPRDPLDDEHILKLADKTLADLARSHKQVQAFVDAKK